MVVITELFEFPFTLTLTSIIAALISLISTIRVERERKKQKEIEEKKDISTYINQSNKKMNEVRTV